MSNMFWEGCSKGLFGSVLCCAFIMILACKDENKSGSAPNSNTSQQISAKSASLPDSVFPAGRKLEFVDRSVMGHSEGGVPVYFEIYHEDGTFEMHVAPLHFGDQVPGGARFSGTWTEVKGEICVSLNGISLNERENPNWRKDSPLDRKLSSVGRRFQSKCRHFKVFEGWRNWVSMPSLYREDERNFDAKITYLI